MVVSIFFFQAEDGIRDHCVTGVQTCALPISGAGRPLVIIVAAGLLLVGAAPAAPPDAPVSYIGVEELKLRLDRRSEERRVGKECRSRWSRYHEKTKMQAEAEMASYE